MATGEYTSKWAAVLLLTGNRAHSFQETQLYFSWPSKNFEIRGAREEFCAKFRQCVNSMMPAPSRTWRLQCLHCAQGSNFESADYRGSQVRSLYGAPIRWMERILRFEWSRATQGCDRRAAGPIDVLGANRFLTSKDPSGGRMNECIGVQTDVRARPRQQCLCC